MVWIIAFLCLGLVGAAGYYQGPIRAAFSFFGLLFGAFMAGPLSPLTQRLLPLIGLHHPAWNIFAPQVLAFLIVLLIFKIAGQVVHGKVAVYFKYKVSEELLQRWRRVYARLGLCVGLLNGVFYFILLTLLIYSAGYFTTEVSAVEGNPLGVRLLTETRADLHAANLDRVLATYDMVPPKVYQAADIATLVLHNPLLISRLGRYPPCLELAEHQEFKDLANDVQLQQMIAAQNKVVDIVEYPKIQFMLTNGTIVAQVNALISKDLDDLQTYLVTGQSATYDPETILGVWHIDRTATYAEVRKRQPGITPLQFKAVVKDLEPRIAGLSLTAMPDNQMLLKQPNPNTSESTIVAGGTWKKESDAYEVNLPGSLPETSEAEITDGNKLRLPKFGKVLVFNKEM